MCVCLVHEGNIEDGGKTVHVVFDYCLSLSPEASWNF
jgi:hypothetical protein